ncbi:hypothetical protein BH09BAC1_BH09BAC1_14920 [soil metagenome]
MKNLLLICLSIITIGAYAQTNGHGKSSPSQAEYAQTIQYLTNAINADNENTDLYVKRADAIYYLNAIYPHQTVSQFKLNDALVDIDKAIKIDGQNPALYSIRGMYHRNITGDLSTAYADLTRAIELDPQNPQWYLERTNYADLDQACADWKKCAELGNGSCDQIRTSLCSK